MSAERRVVVTGLGAVTPLGPDIDTSWGRLLAGEGGGGPITAFAASTHSVRIACEASDFEPERWLDRKTIRKIDRFAQLAVAAARMAESDAGLEIGLSPIGSVLRLRPRKGVSPASRRVCANSVSLNGSIPV